jgi:hypothetical protein
MLICASVYLCGGGRVTGGVREGVAGALGIPVGLHQVRHGPLQRGGNPARAPLGFLAGLREGAGEALGEPVAYPSQLAEYVRDLEGDAGVPC